MADGQVDIVTEETTGLVGTVQADPASVVITTVETDAQGNPLTTIATAEAGPEVTAVVVVSEEAQAAVQIAGTGIPGPPGPAGPPGAAGFDFVQDMPAAEWVIPHSFAYFPSVTVYDTQGSEVDVSVDHASGVATVKAAIPFAGRAHLV